jgi:hypothetical protein
MRKSLLILGIFLVFIFYTPGTSQDADSISQLKASSDAVGNKILALSSIMFKPFTSDEYQTYEWGFNAVGLTIPSGNPGSLSFLAQIQLPDGAVIKRVAAIYYDNSATAGIDIGIGHIAPFDLSEPSPSVSFTSDGLPEVDGLRTFDTTTIPDPIVDNRNIYFALVEFDKETMDDVAFRALYIVYQ